MSNDKGQRNEELHQTTTESNLQKKTKSKDTKLSFIAAPVVSRSLIYGRYAER